ncbi:GIY-YIG_SF superfamily protein [Microcystis phage Mel-JY01]
MGRRREAAETKWVGVVDNTDDYESFVYLIINKLNNRKYIGRKFTKKRNKKKISETSLRRRIVITDSDWKYYKSSCDELKRDIEKFGEDNFEFIVLKWCKKRIEAIYLEVEYQVKNDVLTKKFQDGMYEYYNTNIMSKFYRPKDDKEYDTIGKDKILTEKYISKILKNNIK